MERTNARTITPATLPEPVSLAVIDVAFISLRLILAPVATAFGEPGGDIVALVKPQFEAGRAQVRGGVVRDPAVHRATIESVVTAAATPGLTALDVIASPILGPEGNREFLLHLCVGAVAGAGVGAAAGTQAAAGTPPASLAGRIEAATGTGGVA